MVSLKIDGRPVQAEENMTILEVCIQNGIKIPTLCNLKDINNIGACRMCLVEDAKSGRLQASCVYPVSEGMEILTASPKVLQARRSVLELILSDHDRSCLTCKRNKTCELQNLADELGIVDIEFMGENIPKTIDELSPSIVRDNNKCILCRRCVAACEKTQGVYAIGMQNRGFKTQIGSVFEKSLNDVACINCGQCIAACPTGALTEKDATAAVWAALADPNKYVVFQPAPAVRVAIGEEFGMPIGTRSTGKMVAAMRRLGADKVFDVDFAADLTIMEEGTELLDRIKNGGVLPMITSCSPGWVKYCEHFYPEFIPNLSTCKSPNQMQGAVTKTYFAEKNNLDPHNIFVVSVMPCTAKKFEIIRDEMGRDGYRDVDANLTTRELARMIRQAGIDYINLPDEDFDSILGESTGAAVIFGVTGGVMEAALRTVADILTGEDLKNLEYTAVRGLDGIKEATVSVAGMDINVAIAHGTANAGKLLEAIKRGEKTYHFIEIMGCPGGCVTGGGQPQVDARTRYFVDPRAARAAATYSEDESKVIRKSHQNPAIKTIYAEFLGEPCGHKSHELLHTHYVDRSGK
ncbi:MAG: NADH-dependent [FeFe] hydrogenase, group A6 [Eubacteriales bacterium]|nr:NADH-dependent [FeFe] hydrogenase, group A6 [Clostridia bacterium]MDY5753922.1 NADH-dependent [FeFe] hydrogenase, group A6 [Eubacteriales bacterium]